jgi:hypothetical protein
VILGVRERVYSRGKRSSRDRPSSDPDERDDGDQKADEVVQKRASAGWRHASRVAAGP